MENKVYQVTEILLGKLPERQREILIERFGLFNKKRKTLEEIGRKQKVTRERIRQVQNTAILKLKKSLEEAKEILDYLEKFLKKQGGLKKEDLLIRHLISKEGNEGFLIFLLHLHEKAKKRKEDKDFYTFWFVEETAFNKAQKLINHLQEHLKKKKELYKEDELYKVATLAFDLDKNHFVSYLEISKKIQKGAHGYFGLVDWPEISPKGVKDKAYLVLKLTGRPLHFREITEKINEVFSNNKKALYQTVHNELIKDKRFVLVGRGIYALSEWGYKEGTVKDVILDILKKSKKHLPKEEIIKEVLKQREVKRNTILLALSDKKLFARDNKGNYTLIRK